MTASAIEWQHFLLFCTQHSWCGADNMRSAHLLARVGQGLGSCLDDIHRVQENMLSNAGCGASQHVGIAWLHLVSW